MPSITSGPISGPNPLCPERMSADARLEELGRILAAGVIRLNAESASSLTVTAAGLEVDIRREGIAGIIREMVAPRGMEAAE